MKTMESVTTRPAVAAGRFYPRDPATLRQTVRQFIEDVGAPPLGAVRALIVPHAGYRYGGAVAGAGFATLASLPKADYTLYLIGPAHWWPVSGIGLPSAEAFETPLGVVPVATASVHRCLAYNELYHLADDAHNLEHCLEVELPFLQVVLPHFQIVPMLFGPQTDPVPVSRDLIHWLETDPRSLIVVSSDLSHYHPYAEAVCRDEAFLSAVVNSDLASASQGEACGLMPILCLMAVAQMKGWMAHRLAYCNSGDSGGLKQFVVGYGAIAYTEAELD